MILALRPVLCSPAVVLLKTPELANTRAGTGKYKSRDWQILGQGLANNRLGTGKY